MLHLNWTNLSRFVKAAVSGGFNVCIVFLVLRRCRPGSVGGRGRQQQEERTLRAHVVQEGEGAICLHHRWGKPTVILKLKWLLKLWGFYSLFKVLLVAFLVQFLKIRCFQSPWDSQAAETEGTTRHSSGSLPSSRVPRRESSALVKLYLKQMKRDKLICHLMGDRRAPEKPVVHICFWLK